MRRFALPAVLAMAACAGQPSNGTGPQGSSSSEITATTSLVAQGETGVPRLGANGIGCLARRNGKLICWGETPWGIFDDPIEAPAAPVPLTDVEPGQHMVDGRGILARGREPSWFRWRSGEWKPEPELEGIVQLGIAQFKSCGLHENGGAHCWGTTLFLGKPEAGEVVSLAVGGGHACALSTGGQVSCWGSGALPGVQLQFGEVANVPGVTGARAISAGNDHTCALLETGKLTCWGTIGPGYRDRSPFELAGVDSAIGIASRWKTVCALERDGRVKCYGSPYHERPGAPDKAVLVSGMPPLAKIAAGCGTTAAEELYCWGSRTRARPAVVPDLDDVTAVAAGGAGTCALRRGGEVLCWGKFDHVREDLWEFGPAFMPISIGISDARSIAMSEGPGQRYDLCWIARSGDVRCRGETGVVTPGVRDAAALAVGRNHACAVRKNGEVWCWGGDDSPVFPGGPDTARRIDGLPAIIALDAGDATTCAVDRGGAVWCWGSPLTESTLVAKEMSLRPKRFGISDADSVTVTDGYACARRRNGTAVCFGRNQSAILAPDPANARAVLGPTELSVASVKQIRSTPNFSCVVEDSGRVSCWGFPFPVTLGGRPHVRHVPRGEMPGLSDVEDLVLGEQHACALLRDGRVSCWGRSGGNVGNGTPELAVRLRMPDE